MKKLFVLWPRYSNFSRVFYPAGDLTSERTSEHEDSSVQWLPSLSFWRSIRFRLRGCCFFSSEGLSACSSSPSSRRWLTLRASAGRTFLRPCSDTCWSRSPKNSIWHKVLDAVQDLSYYKNINNKWNKIDINEVGV